MENSVGLLQKFINDEVASSELLEIYSCIKNDNSFEHLLSCLKKTIDKTYDFKFLSNEAAVLQANRREIAKLLDVFAEMLGNNIEQLCNAEYVFTAPSKFEDYCPFPSNDLVLYTNRPVDTQIVIHDGDRYNILSKKLEDTPYYKIWCYELER